MVKIKPKQLIDLQIDDSFFGNLNVPATQNDTTLTIFDKYSNEYIITVENNKIEIYKK